MPIDDAKAGPGGQKHSLPRLIEHGRAGRVTRQPSDKHPRSRGYYRHRFCPPPACGIGRYGTRRYAEMRLLTWSVALLFALAISPSSVEAQQAGGENPAPDNWPKTVEAL